jgi:hypothetical protein
MVSSSGKVVQEILGLSGNRRRHSINDFIYNQQMIATPSQLSSSRKSVPDLKTSSAQKLPGMNSVPLAGGPR